MTLFDLPGIQADMRLVDRYMMEFLPAEQERGKMGEIISAVMSAKGKRYRPLLLLLAGRCGPNFQASRERLCKLGAIVELVHMASLIHDDIVDDSPLRRGQQTIQSRFGKDMAVYTGDMMLGRIMSILFREDLGKAGALLGSTIEDMCRGEVGQFDSRFCLDGSVEKYLDNIYGKTVSLFVTACRIGAMESGCDEKLTDALAMYGLHLGYLFQLRDDMLDFVSDEEQEGKPTHMDFREGVFTLPVLYALAHRDYWETVKELASLAERGQFTSHNTDKLDWAVRYSGGLSATVAQIDAHQHEAERLAKVLPVPEITRAFMEILKRLELPIWQRQYAALACVDQAV